MTAVSDRASVGTLTVVSGFSGVGKGTVVRSLLDRYEGYSLSVSATTRSPRAGEEHGVAYYFMSDQDFEALISADELVEYARYCGHYYGTPRPFLEEQLNQGRNLVLEIEMQGALNIRRLFPDAALVFIVPPSAEALMDRLKGRNTESDEVIAGRLLRAEQEAKQMEAYDYILVNEEIDRCADELHQLIQARKRRVACNRDLIESIRADVTRLAEEQRPGAV